MSEMERKKEFAIKLMEFYEKFLGGMADSIEYLADLQEKYRDEYEEFKQTQMDLNKLPELLDKLDKLDPELKDALPIFGYATYSEERVKQIAELIKDDLLKTKDTIDIQDVMEAYGVNALVAYKALKLLEKEGVVVEAD